MKTATSPWDDSGMLQQLRELAEADPFTPFAIRLQDGTKLAIAKALDIQFTHYGSPKVRAAAKPGDLGERKRWHILNVDAITEIIL